MYGGEDGTRYFALAVGSADSDYYSALVVLPITVAREKAPVNGAFFQREDAIAARGGFSRPSVRTKEYIRSRQE
jgi:hypothetical protein